MTAGSETERAVAALVAWMESLRDEGRREGLARFGIRNDRAFGIPVPVLRQKARDWRGRHDVALALWHTGWHEARILAGMMADPRQLTPQQMDAWVEAFDSWDLCDQCCGNLFWRTSFVREAIGRIVTDSKLPGEPKDPQSTSLTRIYEAFATREEYDAFCQELRDGLGWGEAKKKLIDKINGEIGPMREKYEYYISHPAELEAILQAGAAKARKIASPFIEELRHAVGLRSFTMLRNEEAKAEVKTAAKPLGVVKQYRETDGLFYFKLTEGAETLLTSVGFDSGRDAGMAVGKLKAQGLTDTANVVLSDGVTLEQVNAALAAMRAADEEKKKAKAAKK